MIQRIIPVIIGITFIISGCAKNQDKQYVADFSTGATLLKVAHLASPTADGSSLFITIDGKEAGPLPVGEAMLLQVPAGDHEVGGYARTEIGSVAIPALKVTIPSLKVTTAADQPRFVAYKVAQNAPLFSARGIDPLPESAPIPKKQVGESESLPVPQIIQLSVPESKPDTAVPDAQETPAPASQEATQPAAEGSITAPVTAPTATPATPATTAPVTAPTATPATPATSAPVTAPTATPVTPATSAPVTAPTVTPAAPATTAPTVTDKTSAVTTGLAATSIAATSPSTVNADMLWFPEEFQTTEVTKQAKVTPFGTSQP